MLTQAVREWREGVDQFDFDLSDEAVVEESYLSRYYFANLGLSFTVF